MGNCASCMSDDKKKDKFGGGLDTASNKGV